MNFVEKIIKSSILGYKNIDLEPSSQTYVSVIIKKDKIFLTSINHTLEEVTAEYLVNEFCGGLLVNNIDCPGYNECNFITERGYNFEKILKCKQEDFGTIFYETLLKFSNLCKAIVTESLKTDETFFIEMFYAENYLDYFSSKTDYPYNMEQFEDELDELSKEDKEFIYRKIKALE